MKKLLLGVITALTLALPVTIAAATPPAGGPPGQGDCSHGNSGQTCVPDPQPDNGKDCEEHGNNGGVNEDHCLGTTTTVTTTVPPTTTTTTTTVVPTCEETQTCETTTTTVTTTVPPTTSTETTTVPPVTTTTVSEPPSTTETETSSTTEAPTTGPTQSGGGGPEKPGKLAFTGVEDIVPLGAGVLTLLSTGTGLLWLGSRRRRNI